MRMKKQSVRNGLLTALVMLAAGAAMGLLNHLTPPCSDDYFYRLFYVGPGFRFDLSHPIADFGDVAASQYNHWFGCSGRTVVHTLVQLFAGLWGMTAFHVANAVVFVLFGYVLTRFSSRVTPLGLSFSYALVVLLFPSFCLTMLWMTGSINYLWSSLFVVVFLLWYERLSERPLQPVHLLGFLPGVLAGWTHEGIVFPLALSLLACAVATRKTLRRRASLPLLTGFIIGAAMCCASPGIVGRALGPSIATLLYRMVVGCLVCLKLKAFYALVALLLWTRFLQKEGWRARITAFYRDNRILCHALVLSFGVVFLSGNNSARTAIGVELFSLLLLCRLVALRPTPPLMKRAKAAVCVLGALLWGYTVWCSVPNYREYKRLTVRIETGTSDVVPFKEVAIPDWMEGRVCRPLYSDKTVHYDWFFYYYTWKEVVSAACGRSVLVIPDIIYDDIRAGSERLGDIARQRDYPFYVVPAEPGSAAKPVFELGPVDVRSLPFYLRLPVSLAADYLAAEVPVKPWNCAAVTVEGKNYLFVNKDLLIDRWVKAIVLKDETPAAAASLPEISKK